MRSAADPEPEEPFEDLPPEVSEDDLPPEASEHDVPPEADDVPPETDDGGAGQPGGLDDLGRQILAFERRWWRSAGAKDQSVRDTFGLSPTRYYQLLNALLDDPAAMAADPVTVRRLRRLRATRTVR